jgi:hypothetical protein
MKDITGQEFGKLVVIGPTEKRVNKKIIWECKCDCGETTYSTATNLQIGNTKSCGCITNIKDITDQRFGRLVAIACTDKRYRHISGTVFAIWQCQCDCGNIAFVSGNSLRMGNTKSCGCLVREKATTHGMTYTRTYKSWQAMIQRCYNQKAPNYYLYGGKGIAVENQQWITSFEKFFEEMGERPENKTLGRIDGSKGYYKENCRWETPWEQAQNRGPTGSSVSGDITLNEDPIIIDED